MLRLGPHALKNPWILAPMAGVSELPFRVIAKELGAALCPTELVSSAGLVRASARTKKYLRRDPSERPFCVQLFGGDPGQMAEAAAMAREAGADALDINMGCPVPKVTKNGAGSALLCQPERAAEIVRAVGTAGLPVTVKIRAGWDASRVNAVEVALGLEGAGAAWVAIHARTRAQGYSGRADWSLIGKVKAALRIPVIGNGDVVRPLDARRMMAETGCDAVMIGRGALGNPWIFRELCGGPAPTPEERLALVLRHFDAHLAFVGDLGAGVRQFRKQLLWYAHGLRGASAFRQRAVTLDDPGEVRAAIEAFFGGEGSVCEESGGEQEIDLRGALG
ncbi:MAG: tRNA dihydrouridine synthase DusB [Deltaproteobacteria bacterium]